MIVTQNVNGVATQIPTTATYCFKDGNMLTGWIKTIDGKWYYFTADGSMLVNVVTPDGRLVEADGVVIVTE